jgi:hypothetical protein
MLRSIVIPVSKNSNACHHAKRSYVIDITRATRSVITYSIRCGSILRNTLRLAYAFSLEISQDSLKQHSNNTTKQRLFVWLYCNTK